MRWEAANVVRRPQDPNEESARDVVEATDVPKRRSTETAEAALARLTKSYSAAITCVGALHKANSALQAARATEARADADSSTLNHELFINDAVEQLQRVANAARSALENGVLLDPLILNHVPTLNETMLELSNDSSGEENRWEVLRSSSRPHPPILTSSAHRSTVRQLAYLSLVNYGDLLLSACACSVSRPKANMNTVLDRGVVEKLQILTREGTCCWKGENEEDTQRLALVAFCDASHLQGSDPTLWLRLACSARGLDNCRTNNGSATDATKSLRRYRRLERYALERGRLALPIEVPPNRTVVLALEELNRVGFPETYSPKLAGPAECVKLELDLTRYSWSILGRMLLKACREGAAYRATRKKVSVRERRQLIRAEAFGSPNISLRLSPMLALPSFVLGTICQFLPADSIWRFEATCRALSVSIIAARASMEQELQTNSDTQKRLMAADRPVESTDNSPDSVQGNTVETEERNSSEGRNLTTAHEERRTSSHRSSKRVRSQMITSGKLAERSARRNSVEFCLLASILSVTADHRTYLALLREEISWESLVPMQDLACRRIRSLLSGGSSKEHGHTVGSEKQLQNRHKKEAKERSGDASLTTFIKEFSSQNSGPADMLSRFVTHVARHVEDVFTIDPGGMAVLASCFTDSIEYLAKRRGFNAGLLPSWYGSDVGPVDVDRFAVNILNAELRLKRCERVLIESGYDHDANAVSAMVPVLLRVAGDSHRIEREKTRIWESLKARTHWLAAGFFLWRSRMSQSISESRMAETLGLEHVEKVIGCLDSPAHCPIKIVPTPHLESPVRTELHWKALSVPRLSAFRDDVQASSIVSLARQQFLEILADDEQGSIEGVDVTFSEEDITKLRSIAEKLFKRYDVSYEGRGGKHEELFDDFRVAHTQDFATSDWIEDCGSGQDVSRWKSIWDFVPSSTARVSKVREIPNPSIITILVTCLQSKPGSGLFVALLLTRLVLAAYDQQGFLAKQKAGMPGSNRERSKSSGYGSDDNEDFSGSDSDLESDDATTDISPFNRRGRTEADIKKGRLISLMAHFFIDKLAEICSSCMSLEEKVQFVNNEDFICMLHFSLAFSAEWYSRSMHGSVTLPVPLDLQVLVSLRSLVIDVLCEGVSNEQRRRLESEFFVGLARIIVSQRQLFPSLLRSHGDNRTGRTVRQKVCTSRAEYVGAVANEAAYMLSTNRASYCNGSIIPSFLIDAFCRDSSRHAEASDDTKVPPGAAALVALCDAVLWFWKYGTSAESIGISRSPSTHSARNTFDRPIVEALLAPIASLIVGLCGSAVSTAPYLVGAHARFGICLDESNDARLCLSEFFDSDASANDWSPSDDDEPADQSKHASRVLLRILCQSIQCVALVFDGVSEVLIRFTGPYQMHTNKHGPLLPLVVARVLNSFSEILLLEFGNSGVDTGKRKNIWAKEYPLGCRTTGTLLDSSLYKAYRCLHGFSLLSANSQVNTGKDHGSTAAVHDDVAIQKFLPESEVAAAQLYRCIVRAYAQGRKSPPKAALECVISALPPIDEDERSKDIKKFLFSTEGVHFDFKDVAKLVKKGINADSLMASLPIWTGGGKDGSDGDSTEDSPMEEGFLVRKGVCRELAKGALPQLSSASHDPANCRGDDTKDAEERELAARHERDLSKKFQAILDFLCLGESENCEGWYRAGQCLLMKSELIADRIGFSQGFSRAVDFTVAKHRLVEDAWLGLFDLVTEQERDYQRKLEGWVPFLGKDLSVYVRYPWAKFSSLRSCSAEIEHAVKERHQAPDLTDDGNAAFFAHVWRQIELMYQREDYAGWQQAWGGIFVTALRKIAIRCLCVALCLALKQSQRETQDDDVLVSEISESLGTAHYSMLIGSQMYGYPLHPMTEQRKRQLAETARLCFRHAADAVSLSGNSDDEEDCQTWDLQFMIGKCHEKIAGTYKREQYVSAGGAPSDLNVAGQCRQYERQMNQAFSSYAMAMKEAKAIEESGGLAESQAGGSEHGAVEVFYRLHASRLKCLLFAVRQKGDERYLAESEALRITSKQWYEPPAHDKTWDADESGVRKKVWAVLADIVTALAQCRLDHPFFHRSVYRHAQALMWAQTFHDPDVGISERGLGTVPATKSYQIRGLNSATPCANSAEVVMGNLFEKKRPQLCAVWVTTPSTPPSPFAFLNNSIRKYDSLRGKYLSAYVDCLRLCQRTSKLESLLQWTAACKRDLPAFFRASARAKGGAPGNPHHRDRLLLKRSCMESLGLLQTVKRQANSAIASIVIRDMSDLPITNEKKDQARATQHLKTAYACFLRLNCTVNDVERSRAWKFGRGSIPEVEALCQAFLSMKDHKDVHTQEQSWSSGAQKIAVLNAALEKSQQLFPGLSSTVHSKSGKKRKTSTAATKKSATGKRGVHQSPTEASRSSQGKENAERSKRRQQDDTTTSPFVVSVPEGLVEGDTFNTSIRIGDVFKQVKLTVPPGKPSKLKFSLNIPKGNTTAPSEKRPRISSD